GTRRRPRRRRQRLDTRVHVRGRPGLHRRRSLADGLRGRHQDEVVAVDDLVAALVAEQALDVAGVCAFQALDLRGAVVHETARELLPAGADAADAVTHAEAARDGAHAGREEAAAALAHGSLRALVDVQRARRLEGVGDPVLAPRERVVLGQDERARLHGRVEDLGERALATAVGDDRGNARG